MEHLVNKIKTFSVQIFFSIYFFLHLHIYCRKCNAEFNELIKTLVDRARFFSKIFLTLFGYCLKCSWFRAKNIDQYCTSYRFKKKNPKKIDFFLLKKGKHIVYLKKQKKWYVITPFYSIFNMSSCRKPKIQNDLPKITQIKWICHFF